MLPDPPLKVLVVEDDEIIARTLGEMIVELGHRMAGSASCLEDGMKLAASADIDVGVLDADLGRNVWMPIAHQLRARDVPVIFTTGYSQDDIEQTFSSCPVLTQPLRLNELSAALALRYC